MTRPAFHVFDVAVAIYQQLPMQPRTIAARNIRNEEPTPISD